MQKKSYQLNLEICQPMVAAGKKQRFFGHCSTEKGAIQQYITNLNKIAWVL